MVELSPTPGDIGGLAEVAELVGRPKQTVRNWIYRDNLDTPKPLALLAATTVWDLAEWRQWAETHAHLVHRVQGD